MTTTTCSVEGCSKAPRSRGLCRSHYSRVLRYGDPTPRRGELGTAEVRLNISLPRALDRAVRRAAKREGINLSEWYRRAAAERAERQGRI